MYIVYRAVFTRTGGFVFIWKSQIYYVEVKLHNALFPINSCYSQENYVEVKFHKKQFSNTSFPEKTAFLRILLLHHSTKIAITPMFI